MNADLLNWIPRLVRALVDARYQGPRKETLRNGVGRGYLVTFTGSTWQSRGLRGYYGVYGAITGSTWLLRGLPGAYLNGFPSRTTQ